MPGAYADRSGNGHVDTSGAFVSWKDWKALSEGKEPRPTASQKRLPGPWATTSSESLRVHCSTGDENGSEDEDTCVRQTDADESDGTMTELRGRFVHLRRSPID